MKKKKIKKLLRYSCTGCGTCCSDTVVPVNDSDLRRLVEGTGKNPLDIVQMYSIEEIDWDEDRDGWINLATGRMIMGLKQRKERCLFLNPSNRCRAYTHRPITCRSFPYDIEIEHGAISHFCLNDRVDCEVEKGGKMCTFKEIRKIALTEETQDKAFYDKIKLWNLNYPSFTKKEFLEFIGFEL